VSEVSALRGLETTDFAGKIRHVPLYQNHMLPTRRTSVSEVAFPRHIHSCCVQLTRKGLHWKIHAAEKVLEVRVRTQVIEARVDFEQYQPLTMLSVGNFQPTKGFVSFA
jgi:hypothetical protein